MLTPRAPPVLALAVFAVSAILGARPGAAPFLVWNNSLSVPIGLYAIADGELGLGAVAAVRLPPDVAAYADARGYLARNAVLLKPVASIAGQRVCRFGRVVTGDRHRVAVAAAFDANGRPLPRWRGCSTLTIGDVFLISRVPGSFDGRYFGVLREATVVGRARPLWTWSR